MLTNNVQALAQMKQLVQIANINFISDDICNIETYWLERIKQLRQKFNFHSIVNVKIFSTFEDMCGYFDIRLPTWVIGSYDENTIYILDYKEWKGRNLGSFGQVLVHEFVHVILANILNYPCPIWINEGIAQYFADQFRTMNYSYKDIKDFDLYNMGYENTNIYSVSALFMSHLIEKYSEEVILNKLFQAEDITKDNLLGKEGIIKIIKKLRYENE